MYNPSISPGLSNEVPAVGGRTPGGQIIGHDSLCHRFTATDEYERAYMVIENKPPSKK